MIGQYFHALNLLVTKLHFLCTHMTGPLDWRLNHYVGTRNHASKRDSSVEGKFYADRGELSESCKAVPLKISKPDAVKFSGQSRDFASFKCDFMAIILINLRGG